MKHGPDCYDPLCEKHNPKSMNYCNCPNCRTDNCHNAESPVEKADPASGKDGSYTGQISSLKSRLSAQGEEIEKLRAALERSKNCIRVMAGHHYIFSDVSPSVEMRCIDAALTKPQPSQT